MTSVINSDCPSDMQSKFEFVTSHLHYLKLNSLFFIYFFLPLNFNPIVHKTVTPTLKIFQHLQHLLQHLLTFDYFGKLNVVGLVIGACTEAKVWSYNDFSCFRTIVFSFQLFSGWYCVNQPQQSRDCSIICYVRHPIYGISFWSYYTKSRNLYLTEELPDKGSNFAIKIAILHQ